MSDEAQELIEEMTKKYDDVHPKLLDAILNLKLSSVCNDAVVIEVAERYVELFALIKDCHKQHADDLCWQEIDRIFIAVGLPVPDRKVGDIDAMYKNCWRFLKTQCSGGAWKSYVELEKELAAAQKDNTVLKEEVGRLREEKKHSEYGAGLV